MQINFLFRYAQTIIFVIFTKILHISKNYCTFVPEIVKWGIVSTLLTKFSFSVTRSTDK